MRCKKFIFNVLIKTGLFYGLIYLSYNYSAENAMIVHGQQNKAISIFLGLSFTDIYNRTKYLSDDAKKDLCKKIIADQDKDLVRLFNIATMLPPETQAIIASKLLNNNMVQAQRFISRPLIQELERYFFACDVIDGKKLAGFRSMFKFSKQCRVSVVYNLLDEIKIIDDFVLSNADKCNYRQLRAISNVFDLKSFDDKNMSYAYRKSYTLSNFVKTISPHQIIAFVILSLPIFSALIEKNFCNKTVLVQKIYDENRRNALSNMAFNAEYEKTGDEFWSTQYQMKDPFTYSWYDWVKKSLPFLMIVPSGFIIQDGLDNSIKDTKQFFLPILLGSLVYWIGGFIFSEMILSGLSRLSSLSSFFENQFKVSGTILGVYILGASLYNVIKMRKAKKSTVAIKDIAALLQRTDIDIE